MIEYVKRNDLGLTDFEIVMCGGDYKEALKMLLDKIEKAPAADVVEVRHGSWEFTEDVDMPWCTKAVCTSCGVPIADNIDLSQSFGRERFIRYNRYCPDCGAKMDGEKNK